MTSPKKAVVLTDSLGMPRAGFPPEATWVGRLRSQLLSTGHWVIPVSQRAMTIRTCSRLAHDIFTTYAPAVVVVQVGVVDSVRRALPRWFSQFAATVPVLGPIVRKLSSRYHYFLTRSFNFHTTSLRRFEREARAMLDGATVLTIVVAIAPPGEFMIRKTHRCAEDIQMFNSVLMRACEDAGHLFVDPFAGRTGRDVCVPEDGHHLSDLGHELVTEAVVSVIRDRI